LYVCNAVWILVKGDLTWVMSPFYYTTVLLLYKLYLDCPAPAIPYAVFATHDTAKAVQAAQDLLLVTNTKSEKKKEESAKSKNTPDSFETEESKKKSAQLMV